MDIFTLKNIKVTPVAPAIGDPVTVTGEVYLFGIPYICPLWIIAAAQYPKSLWQKIMPILNGATEVRQTTVVLGGKFSLTFPTGFTDGGDFPLFVDAYGGPEAVVSNITLPPFPAVAHYGSTLHVATNDEVPVGFEWGTPTASPLSALSGDTVVITLPVKSTSAKDQPDMSVVLEVRETALVGQGSLVGGTITSDKVTIKAGASNSFKFSWKAAGAIGKKTIGGTLLKAGSKAPNTKPDNPYGGGSFQNLFEVIAKKPGTSLEYGAITVETATGPATQPSNKLLTEPDGTKITIKCSVKNTSGFALPGITAAFQVKEESAIGTGTIVGDIAADKATSLPDKSTLVLSFPWTVSGGVCRKVGILTIKQNGNAIDSKNYGNIVEKITPRTLTLKVSPSSLTDIKIITSPAKAVYKDGEPVTISLSVAQAATFDHWGGDTGVGSSGTDDWGDYRGLSVIMDKDRTITAYFNSETPPPAVGYTVSAVNPPSGSTTWFLQHTNETGSNDFNSGWVDISAAVQVSNNTRGYFQGAFKDASGNIIGNKSTDFYTPDIEGVYYWDYAANILTKNAPPVGQPHNLFISANMNGAGRVTISPYKTDEYNLPSYAPGEAVTITASVNAGYAFTGWSGDVSETSRIITITMPDRDVNIEADFQSLETFQQYNLFISANMNDAGDVSISPVKRDKWGLLSYDAGDVVTLTATAKDGYVFDGWSGDVSDSSPTIDVTITKETNIEADFHQA